MVLTATIATPIPSLFVVRSEDLCFKQQKITSFRPVGVKDLSFKQQKITSFRPVGVKPLRGHIHPFESKKNVARAFRGKHSSLICAAALNAQCSAAQTQTIERRSSTITVAPSRGKIKSPDLDDGGTGFPPRDNGGGGGGGGGGGDGWEGGWLFFGFLFLLSMIKNDEGEKERSR